MEPSIPKRLFDEITGAGEAAAIQYLESLVTSAEKTFESQFLEFKSGGTHKVGEAWSRELSAFANTDGGVVVWGLRTERHDGVDYASTLEKVPNPLDLKAELEKQLQHGTDPPVSGVEILPFPSSGDPGFVVCHIPESTYKPHRALLCAGHPYFGRFSHRTDIIPTAWLRRLFYPEKALRLMGRLDVVANDDIESKWQINGCIANEGPVTAQSMYVQIVSNRICKFQAMGDWQLVNQGNKGRTFERGGDGYDYVKERDYYAQVRSLEPLHPGNETWPFQCVEVHGLVKSGMEIEVTVYSLDQAPLTTKFVIGRQIYEQVATETKGLTQVTIQLQPPRELLAIG